MNRLPRALHVRRPRQDGVVLFIALIAMVILSLGGVALVRSMDAGTSVAGNLAFRQASIVAVNRAIEDAVDKLYKSAVINTINDDLPHQYFATLQVGELSDGTPLRLSGNYTAVQSGYGLSVWSDPASLVEVRYIIERVCNAAAAGAAPTIATCDLLPPKVSKAGTDNEYKGIPLPPIPHYRVSVRVDLPGTNSTTVAQAFLR